MRFVPWGPDPDGDLVEPPPNAPYSALLRSEPVTTGALQTLGGVLLALAGYATLLPALAFLLLGLTWLVRGLPGSFAEYRTAALHFEYVEGMIASHLAIASLIVLTMFIVRKVHHLHPKWLNSVQPGFRWRYALACLLVCLIGLNAVYWVSRGSDAFTWAPGEHFGWWLLVIVATAPLQAAGEEYLFRGYLLQAAGAVGRSPWLAVVISAVVFASLHGTQNAPLFIDRLGFGVLAGALVVLTGGLEAAIAAHVINNVFAFGYAAAAGGIAQARTMQVSTWSTTGWNLLAYTVVALACWFVGRRMRVATCTPDLEPKGRIG